MQSASIPKGTRDFTPEQMNGRNFIISTITDIYKLYGFQQIETPAMENLSTLTGKYGDEGDQLLFKVLDSGDFLSKIDENTLVKSTSKSLLPEIASKGLRYDLTIPFARYVVQHQNDINFPFRRYQVQPVWRADRPQKGRYREFWQCDVDIIGTDSLVSELDLLNIYHRVFSQLELANYALKINHRKLLEAVAYTCGMQSHFKSLTVAIDKLDKIGWEGVSNELSAIASDQQISQLKNILKNRPLTQSSLRELQSELTDCPEKTQALEDLGFLCTSIDQLPVKDHVGLDMSLARGLDYYTGCIFEAIIPDSGIGSVSGGGRYDNLTGVFGLQNVSGVGISFGIDRLYDVLEHLGRFKQSSTNHLDILFVHFDKESMAYCLKLAEVLRNQHVKVEVYPDNKKFKKQMDFANRSGVKYVGIVGETEVQNNFVKIKNMQSGEQENVASNHLAKLLS